MIAPSLRKRTIGAKLNRLVILSIVMALVVGAGISCWREAVNFVASKQATMFATANVFASATSRAVANQDIGAVTQAIRAIARIPGFIFADVRNLNGATISDIGAGARLAGDLVLTPDMLPSPIALLSTRTLTVTVPIIDGGRTVGEIELVSSASGLLEKFAATLADTAIGALAALLVGLTFAFFLKRSISRPIETLAQAMTAVERTGNYGSPVVVKSNDEIGVLATRFNSMIGEIQNTTQQILDREKEIIERLGKAGEMRDDQTGQHVVRVAEISRVIAAQLGFPAAFVEDICRASPTHDVGKISISDAILHKPGRLTLEERREMEKHALRGFEILAGSNSELVNLAAEIAISHHERWDGRGYPNRLAGDEIPISGRITAVADVCDALLSERPYKQPWSLEDVRAFLVKESGAHFDPICVSALLNRWSDLQGIYQVSALTFEAA